MRILALSSCLLLAACASAPMLQDQPLQLQPGQGIAAVSLDAPQRIQQMKFSPRFKGGSSFEVPDTQGGPSLYLLPVQAGRYCLQHFYYDHNSIESKEDLGCFTVVEGKITYSGTIVPETGQFNGSGATTLYTSHYYYPASFHEMLKASYPKLAAAYPLAEAPAAPEGARVTPPGHELSAWTVADDKTQVNAVFIRNNTSWSVKLERFLVSECVNVQQPCGERKLDIVLAPFEVRQIATLSAADKHAGFSYSYNYDFVSVD